MGIVCIVSIILKVVDWTRDVQIPNARSHGWLNFVCWHIMFVVPQYGTSLVSPFWHLEF